MNGFPKPVIDAMADRAMRLHHMLWHTARDSWSRATPEQQEVFRHHGWEPPRPSLTAPDPVTGTPSVELENGSGEDFLFMHRQMIATVDEILAESGDPLHPRVEGWPTIPAPQDTEYPVPPPFDIPGDDDTSAVIRNAKSQESFDRIRQWEAEFTDPAKLRQTSLRRLGARIEFGIHNRMHLRWSAEMPSYRTGGDAFSVDHQWDDAAYNWLADTYSAHVNPIFWKLHGWVDARIDDWMAANQLTGPVPWSFDPPWSGPAGGHDHHHPVALLALRARPGNAEADALQSRLKGMETAVEHLKHAGVTEPARFAVYEDV
ncbi:hypothetical protein GCM10010503_18970 [Streptomyces lucensis JCM 4490]|uniref:Uncharacterized protein n=1 Tax=Streptomyces lucensis JCM 4490 TaxID=1306176 RepID=A0A918MPM8_9ACTN|nr:Tat pathway signal protein [Streptomyces lucensis]GGW42701.1 hypothetical protein GCM10010503_18970 [Streptomyces lucensis JCM 4490]